MIHRLYVVTTQSPPHSWFSRQPTGRRRILTTAYAHLPYSPINVSLCPLAKERSLCLTESGIKPDSIKGRQQGTDSEASRVKFFPKKLV
jgi:hypothetical protein